MRGGNNVRISLLVCCARRVRRQPTDLLRRARRHGWHGNEAAAQGTRGGRRQAKMRRVRRSWASSRRAAPRTATCRPTSPTSSNGLPCCCRLVVRGPSGRPDYFIYPDFERTRDERRGRSGHRSASTRTRSPLSFRRTTPSSRRWCVARGAWRAVMREADFLQDAHLPSQRGGRRGQGPGQDLPAAVHDRELEARGEGAARSAQLGPPLRSRGASD